MDFTKEIADFISANGKDGVTVIDQATGEIVYADAFFTNLYGSDVTGKDAKKVYDWLAECPLEEEGITEWEIIDAGKYFAVNTRVLEKEGKKYVLHELTDITVYMSLNRDMTRYMSFFKKLSSFQTKVMQNLQNTYYETLPMLSDFFKSGRIYLMLQRGENLDIVKYDKESGNYDSVRIPYNPEIMQMENTADLVKEGVDEKLKEVFADEMAYGAGGFVKLVNGTVSEEEYVVFASLDSKTDIVTMKEDVILNVIRMSIENSIMREHLIYNSEHDMLTGLYNKGKYLSMLENDYQKMDSIAIFNMDLNYLKQMNDNYGHEYGDKLLIKAADSIRKVTNNKVHGYRIGGDEYFMIACNMEENEVMELKARWEEELEKLNANNDGMPIPCVIACGLVYGKAPYNYEEMSKKADALMYEDKKAKKKPGEEIR